jgi:hypothetical protein
MQGLDISPDSHLIWCSVVALCLSSELGRVYTTAVQNETRMFVAVAVSVIICLHVPCAASVIRFGKRAVALIETINLLLLLLLLRLEMTTGFK